MPDELIDIYNEDNESLDAQIMKSEAHKKGLWHRTAHIWIYNSNGEMLLQLRAKNKEFYPDMWDISVAGHVSLGEDPEISALREIKEEIGLSIKKEDLDFFKIRKNKEVFNDLQNNEFYYIYLFKFDGSIKELNIQKDELSEIIFLPVEKIEEELKEHPDKYVPHGDYWTEIINQVKRRINE